MSNIELLEELHLPVDFFIYDNSEAQEISDVECIFYNSGVGDLYEAYKENKKEEDLQSLIKRCIERLTEHQKQLQDELLHRKDPEYNNEENQYTDIDFANFIFTE